MKPTKQLPEGKGPIELVEEAFHLLRLAPASTLASYYLGSLPFVLVLLFFWSDMSRSAFAEQRLAAGAFALSLLFFWMKTWQAMFAQELLARLAGEPAPRWTFSRWLRVGLVQAILQPSGLFLLPIALGILVPFGWTYAFYQSLTALGDGQDADLRLVFKRAWRQAKLWPLQNHNVLFLLQPFALFVFLNLATTVLAIPWLLSKLFGVETVFSQSLSATLNTTFFAAILGLTYLCMDPIVKTIYVLRCFYGESLKTGRDLKAELKSFRLQPKSAGVGASILLLTLALPMNLDRSADAHLLIGPMKLCRVGRALVTAPLAASDGPAARRDGRALPSPAAESSASPQSALSTPRSPALSPPDLDRSIDEVLHQREFSWRMPREKLQEKDETKKGAFATLLESILGTLKDSLKAVGRWLDDLLRWLSKYLRPRSSSGGSGGTSWISALYGLLWLVAAGLVCALVFLLYRAWQDWRQPAADLGAQAIVPSPDLADESVGAEHLPEEGWLKLARELLEKGQLRLALRAFYLASLAHLAESNLITIARFKSNRDYERELQRRAHALPEVLSTFAQNVSIFDRVWYGLHEVNPELLTHFAGNVDKIKLTRDERE